MMPIPGQIVYSKAGRDKEKYFVIIEVIDENYVFISDGDMRRVDNPKKKKIKHLLIMKKQAKNVMDKMRDSKRITNSDIRRCLMVFKDDLEQTNQENL